MNVATAVGHRLAALGVDHVFGVVGSGNFHVTNALVAGGARFVAAAHEGGAATMADAYARVSGRLGVLSVHQGPGLTNALTGIAEAAKSRTPLLVLAPEVTNPRSNFFIDLEAISVAVGAGFRRLRSAETAASEVGEACVGLRGTLVLGLPLDLQAEPAVSAARAPTLPPAAAGLPVDECLALADALTRARRPAFIAGRGAAVAPGIAATRSTLVRLGDRCGALLATSAAAKGLFRGEPWDLDVSGGFATPLAAELIASADLIVAWGSTLNVWTTKHGRLIAPGAVVVQVDHDPTALGANRPITLGVPGDVTRVAAAVDEDLRSRGWIGLGWRNDALRDRIAAVGRWRDVSYVDDSRESAIDPRTLTIALDDLLPAERVVAVDSGNFMGYPSMFLSVPDAAGFCFTQAYQSIGLGLATAVGAALARPDRLPVAALGDGGFLMSVAELATVVRLGLPMVVVVYNDAAYGAEVHHFGPDGHPLDTVTFPDTDLAAIGRGFGCHALTVRSVADLAGVSEWLAGPRDAPLLLDAKVRATRGSWWLEEAFRGH